MDGNPGFIEATANCLAGRLSTTFTLIFLRSMASQGSLNLAGDGNPLAAAMEPSHSISRKLFQLSGVAQLVATR